MMKKNLSFVLILILTLSLFPVVVTRAAEFSGGEGTEQNPYIITTAEQLVLMEERIRSGPDSESYRSAHYKLGNDLDLSAYGADWRDGRGWRPIATHPSYSSAPPRYFSGVFDGNYHTIKNLFFRPTSGINQGLFGGVFGEIKNLGLIDVNIIEADVNHSMPPYYIGTLVGAVVGGKITNCYVTGRINNAIAGGLVGGVSEKGSITNCYAMVDVLTPFSISVFDSGGLAAYFQRGALVKNCYATGTVTGNVKNNAGLVGTVDDGELMNCVALNPSVKVLNLNSASFDAAVGRVTAEVTTGKLSNNYALSNMATDGGIPFPTPPETYNVHDGLNGADVSAETARTSEFWTDTMGWGTNVWHIEDGKLPTLKGFDSPHASVLIADFAITKKGDGFNINASMFSDEDTTANIYVALYDANGRMLSMSQEPKVLSAGGAAAFDHYVDYNLESDESYVVKMFAWDDEMVPLSDAAERN